MIFRAKLNCILIVVLLLGNSSGEGVSASEVLARVNPFPWTRIHNLEQVLHLQASATQILFSTDSKSIYFDGPDRNTLSKFDIKEKTSQEINLDGCVMTFVLDGNGRHLCAVVLIRVFDRDVGFLGSRVEVVRVDTDKMEIVNRVDVFSDLGRTVRCMVVFSTSSNSWVVVCDRNDKIYIAAFDLETLEKTNERFVLAQEDGNFLSFLSCSLRNDNLYNIPGVHATIGFDFLGNSFIWNYETGNFLERQRVNTSKHFSGPFAGSIATFVTDDKKMNFFVMKYDSGDLLSSHESQNINPGKHDHSHVVDIALDFGLLLYLIPSTQPVIGLSTPQSMLIIDIPSMEVVSSEVSRAQHRIKTATFSPCGKYIATVGFWGYTTYRDRITVYRIAGR